MRSSILAIAAAALLAFAVPVSAQDAVEEETVSDAVDIAIWCGAFYYFASQGAGPETDAGNNFAEAADAAYAQARIALEEDGIDPAEYDRIIEYYVEIVVEDLSTEGAELRYSEEDCADLIGA